MDDDNYEVFNQYDFTKTLAMVNRKNRCFRKLWLDLEYLFLDFPEFDTFSKWLATSYHSL